MARVLSGRTDVDKLIELSSMTYKEQAVWFLNAFWEDFAQNETERIWKYVKKFAELDLERKAEGNALDELNAHRFLEAFHETLTVRAMRDSLRSTGAIGERVKEVPLIHILIFRFGADWHTLVNAPQGSQEEIDKAQRLLDEVNAAFRECEARDQEAAAALAHAKAQEAEAKRREAAAKEREAEAKAREAEAKAAEAEARAREAEAREREAEARAREDELRAAQQELEAALAELKAQEDAYNQRTEELKRASEEGGLVSRNKAKNELAQHLSSDPLPLRRAKITQEAAVNKADKATKIAADARAIAEEAANQASQARAAAEEAANQASQARAAAEEAARQATRARAAAEEARLQATRAKEAAEEALEEAKRKVEEAEAYLEEVKARIPHGTTWWMERELHEARAYLPKNKGGYNPREK